MRQNAIGSRAFAAAGTLAGAVRRGLSRRARGEVSFRRIFEQCPVGVAVLKPDQSILRANPAFHALIAGHAIAPPGGVFWDLVHPDDLKTGAEDRRRLLERTLDNIRREMRFRRADGAWFWADVTASAVVDERGELLHFVAILEDITARRETEADLIRSNADLALYASFAAHDLQEPVRKIITYGQVLAKAGDLLQKDARLALQKIQGAAARMRDLIEDLLEYSRVSTVELSTSAVDLNVILREVLLDFEAPIAESRAEVKVSPLPEIEANALQMRLLFQNLISNALKFVKPGEPPRIEVRAEMAESGLVRIEVEDRGIGFDPKFAGRIFKPFQRLHDKNVYEGSGIGLAICKTVAERHGGSIVAKSEPGKGACFRVILPVRARRRS